MFLEEKGGVERGQHVDQQPRRRECERRRLVRGGQVEADQSVHEFVVPEERLQQLAQCRTLVCSASEEGGMLRSFSWCTRQREHHSLTQVDRRKQTDA